MSGDRRGYVGRNDQRLSFATISPLYYEHTAKQIVKILLERHGIKTNENILVGQFRVWRNAGILRGKNNTKSRRNHAAGSAVIHEGDGRFDGILFSGEGRVDNSDHPQNEGDNSNPAFEAGQNSESHHGSKGAVDTNNAIVDWSRPISISGMTQGVCLLHDAEQYHGLQQLKIKSKIKSKVEDTPELRTFALGYLVHDALGRHGEDMQKISSILCSKFDRILSPAVICNLRNIQYLDHVVNVEKIDFLVHRMDIAKNRLRRFIQLGNQMEIYQSEAIIKEYREEMWEWLVSILHPEHALSTLELGWVQRLIEQLNATYEHESCCRQSRNMILLIGQMLENQLQVSTSAAAGAGIKLVDEVKSAGQSEPDVPIEFLRTCCNCRGGPYSKLYDSCIEWNCGHRFCPICAEEDPDVPPVR